MSTRPALRVSLASDFMCSAIFPSPLPPTSFFCTIYRLRLCLCGFSLGCGPWTVKGLECLAYRNWRC